MRYVFEGAREPWNPKPIPKFKTLNVECNSFFLVPVASILGPKAPVGIYTYTLGHGMCMDDVGYWTGAHRKTYTVL